MNTPLIRRRESSEIKVPPVGDFSPESPHARYTWKAIAVIIKKSQTVRIQDQLSALLTWKKKSRFGRAAVPIRTVNPLSPNRLHQIPFASRPLPARRASIEVSKIFSDLRSGATFLFWFYAQIFAHQSPHAPFSVSPKRGDIMIIIKERRKKKKRNEWVSRRATQMCYFCAWLGRRRFSCPSL